MTARNPFYWNIKGKGRAVLERTHNEVDDEVLVPETPAASPERPKIVRSNAIIVPDVISVEKLYVEMEAAMNRIRALEAEVAALKAREKARESAVATQSSINRETREQVMKAVLSQSLQVGSFELRLQALERPRPPPLPFFLPIPANLSTPAAD